MKVSIFDFFNYKIQDVCQELQKCGLKCRCNDRYIDFDGVFRLNKLSSMIYLRKYKENNEWPNWSTFINQMRKSILIIQAIDGDKFCISEEIWIKSFEIGVKYKSEAFVKRYFKKFCFDCEFVPFGCMLDGVVLFNYIAKKEDPCINCCMDKFICGGRNNSDFSFDGYLNYITPN